MAIIAGIIISSWYDNEYIVWLTEFLVVSISSGWIVIAVKYPHLIKLKVSEVGYTRLSKLYYSSLRILSLLTLTLIFTIDWFWYGLLYAISFVYYYNWTWNNKVNKHNPKKGD